ncbi:MAG: winged helix-turn-helix domain-containing protein, partial [Pseudomonadota bacterium]
QLFADQTPLEIPRREMSVLECLISAKGRLVSKTALLDYAYGVGADVEETVIEVYISRLRTRVGPFGVTIKAQRGLGYQLLQPKGPDA